MRAAGEERHHHLGSLIGKVKLGDLQTDGRIGVERVLAFELGDLLAVKKIVTIGARVVSPSSPFASV